MMADAFGQMLGARQASLPLPPSTTSQPPMALPPMMTPSAMPMIDTPKEKRKGKKKKGDADAQMKNLLYQSETHGPPGEIRQIRDEWHRFWFPDQEDCVTPQRIRGRIY